MDLAGAAAIVTGGAGGFGAATTRRLVAAGAKVLVADLAEERAQDLVAELGDAVRFHRTDVFKRTVDIFLTGTFRVLSQAAVQMATNEPLDSGQRGVVITTASIAGLEGAPGQSDYSAAK